MSTPPNNQPNLQESSFVRRLLHAALVAWSISLALPAFSFAPDGQTMYGVEALFLGIVFGWGTHGWAVYANLFFLFAFGWLHAGKRPVISILLMLTLAATLLFFPREVSHISQIGILSWGWGAVVWVISLLLISVVAGVHARLFSERGAKILLAAIAVFVATVIHTHYYQWLAANEQEREIYLYGGMAITRAELCGVPLAWPKEPVIPRGTIVNLDIDPVLRRDTSLFFPQLLNYQENGFAWKTYVSSIYAPMVKVRYPAAPNRPVLKVRATDKGVTISLLDAVGENLLFEQQLKHKKINNARAEYCPLSSRPGWKRLTKGYDRALLRALGQDQIERQAVYALESEAARQPCSVSANDVDGIQGLRTWDGRQVVVSDFVQKRVGFCSEHYIGLVEMYSISTSDSNDLGSAVYIFDRRTLEPLAAFSGGGSCSLPKGCPSVSHDIVKAVRISNQTIVIETSRGEYVSNRAGS